MLAVTALLENIFPPTPSDVAVALGAFLSHGGVTTPMAVFLVAWASSSIGAVVVYFVARRYGRTLFSTRLGRKLLSPHAVATIEREYLRFGIAGIFLGRLLPGVRSFVAPFAGIMSLSPLKALAPMILASGLWYGGLTLAGTTLGAEWESINRFLGGLNQTLAYLAGAIVLVVAGFLILRRFRRREERLMASITHAFGARPAGDRPEDEEAAMAAAATLMMELARADDTLSPEELETVAAYLRQRWGIGPVAPGPEGASWIERAKLQEYANRLTQEYQKPEREALVSRLWHTAFGEGALSEHENRLMRRAGLVLGLSEAEVERAREQARTDR
jgi:membrane protein DedA with SNARE-associated domain